MERAVAHPWLVESYEEPAALRESMWELEDEIVKSFRSFGQYSKLKKATLMIVAHRSDPKQISELRKAFQMYDRNHNGDRKSVV